MLVRIFKISSQGHNHEQFHCDLWPHRRLLSWKEKLARRQAEERSVQADVVSIRVLQAEREGPTRDEEQNGQAFSP